MWGMITEVNIPPYLIKAMKSLFRNTVIRIKYMNGQISEPITTNQGIRQECRLSPTLFNIYMNKVIMEWKEEMSGIK
jgi:hypothetical protein